MKCQRIHFFTKLLFDFRRRPRKVSIADDKREQTTKLRLSGFFRCPRKKKILNDGLTVSTPAAGSVRRRLFGSGDGGYSY